MRRLMALLPLFLAILVGLENVEVLGQTNLQIDHRKTFQTIDGFGASDAWTINPMVKKWIRESDDRGIDNVADLLFSTQNGIGLSAWRFNIGAGSTQQGADSLIPDPLRRAELFITKPFGSVDENQHIGQVRMLREAHRRGGDGFHCLCKQPAFLGNKKRINPPDDGKNVGSSNLDPQTQTGFRKVTGGCDLLFARGSSRSAINYLSPLNEPTWDWQGKTQEGCPYNIDDIKALYRAVHAQLVESGLDKQVHLDGRNRSNIPLLSATSTKSCSTKKSIKVACIAKK